ncbi:MAG: hypothetical protein A2Y50_02905 [Pseudomonadales bacterium RIFCSPLOWO2_12_59_9]|nr:MAG: hypothetical protein A2Y50_02905 [Pseudomonadales bacterium RIFCSPLOWO2_12_59_9]
MTHRATTLGQSLGYGISAEQRNKVLRNTYWLLAMTMVPTVLGAWVGVATGITQSLNGILGMVVFLGGAFAFMRGVGLLGAIELVKNKQTRERYVGKGVGMICRGHCFGNGLIMRAVGDTMIIAPPLVISKAEIDELIDKARLCLDLTLQDLQK